MVQAVIILLVELVGYDDTTGGDSDITVGGTGDDTAVGDDDVAVCGTGDDIANLGVGE